MSEFSLYFGLGLDHILDINGYDHIMFVIALSSLYRPESWRQILIMVTAFTLGHSVTLALATLKVISFDSSIIEFLIPVTIVFTCFSNLVVSADKVSRKKVTLNAFYASFFGLIHGMGFSNYLRSLLGQEESIVMPLFAFNIGLEVGQIIIVAIFLIVSFIFVSIIGVVHRDWKMIISSMVAGIGITLMWGAVYW